MTRRDFLAALGGAAAGLVAARTGFRRLGKVGPKPFRSGNLLKDGVARAEAGAPSDLARRAVEALGGMRRLVKPGDRVAVKPNMAFDRSVEQGANTHPEVVAAVVEMCLEAGAASVTVFDRALENAERAYERSGIREAALKAGASVVHPDESRFIRLAIPDALALRSWTFAPEALGADVLINVPVAKHHAAARLTAAMKNLLGVLGGFRGELHQDLSRNIVDINSVVNTDLTVLDATRVIVRNGPTGGDPKDVRHPGIVAASIDRVALDAFASTLLPHLGPRRVEYLALADGRILRPGGKPCSADFENRLIGA